MKLLYAKASPFARKVIVALIEKGIADQVELIETTASPVESNRDLEILNPLGKLPCLVDDDDRAVFDSRVMLRLIEELDPATPIYWRDREAIQQLTNEALCEGILDAAILCVYEERYRVEEHRSDSWLSGQQSKILRSLEWIEENIEQVVRSEFDCVGIALSCALGYLDFRQPLPDWRPAHPKLAGWFSEVASRPSMIQTMPE